METDKLSTDRIHGATVLNSIYIVVKNIEKHTNYQSSKNQKRINHL